MFSLICVWINAWINNREGADLRHHHTHYAVTVMYGKITGNVSVRPVFDVGTSLRTLPKFHCVKPPIYWNRKWRNNGNVRLLSRATINIIRSNTNVPLTFGSGHHWNLEMDNQLHATVYLAHDYLISRLGLQIIHNSKISTWGRMDSHKKQEQGQ